MVFSEGEPGRQGIFELAKDEGKLERPVLCVRLRVRVRVECLVRDMGGESRLSWFFFYPSKDQDEGGRRKKMDLQSGMFCL